MDEIHRQRLKAREIYEGEIQQESRAWQVFAVAFVVQRCSSPDMQKLINEMLYLPPSAS